MLSSEQARPEIRRLSHQVVNLIAAGEVIERPAAALKEIVENAVDSGATEINVALVGGGVDRIEVLDNGCGMTADDLLLAVERHCTSKLPGDNLSCIRTLGFRGEALPSIGASARLTIVSRVMKAETAWEIRVDGGQITAPAPSAGMQGTRVIVEDLFFATPARRKFLKSPRVEFGHAEVVMRRIALSVPGCAIKFSSDSRIILDLPVQTAEERARSILAEGDELFPLDVARDDKRLTGYICGPAVTRQTASGQFITVNGRPVSDPMLKTAIRVAYRPLIEAGRFPVLALALEVPSDLVDVNVHPAKTELRFAQEADVKSFLIGSLQRALGFGAGQSGHRAQFSRSRSAIQYPRDSVTPTMCRAPDGLTRQAPRQVSPDQGYLGTTYGKTRDLPRGNTASDAGHVASAGTQHVQEVEASGHKVVQLGGMFDGNEGFRPHARSIAADIDPSQQEVAGEHPLGAPVAQVLDTYIIAVADDGNLVLVDQHAAHERLTHEHLLTQWTSGQVQTQRLLLPEVVTLTPRSAEILLAFAPSLAQLGLEIESFGSDSIVLRTVPALLQHTNAATLMRDLADELADDDLLSPSDAAAIERRIDAVIAKMACHGSVRAGRRLKPEEMTALLRQMEATPRANTCSHGRPTWLKLSKGEIERLFGRR